MGVEMAPLERRLENDRAVPFDKIKKPRLTEEVTGHGVGPGNTPQVQTPVSPDLLEIEEQPVYLEDYLLLNGIRS